MTKHETCIKSLATIQAAKMYSKISGGHVLIYPEREVVKLLIP